MLPDVMQRPSEADSPHAPIGETDLGDTSMRGNLSAGPTLDRGGAGLPGPSFMDVEDRYVGMTASNAAAITPWPSVFGWTSPTEQKKVHAHTLATFTGISPHSLVTTMSVKSSELK